MKNCCIIGHRKIENIDKIKEKVEQVYIQLIEEEGVTRFLFGSNGQFNDLAFDMLKKLRGRKIYDVNMVNYLRKGEIGWTHVDEEAYYRVGEKPPVKRFYDEIVEDDRVMDVGVRRSYVVRNQKMIDDSDICLFYYDRDYEVATGSNSCTRMAYEYAVSQNKKIIII